MLFARIDAVRNSPVLDRIGKIAIVLALLLCVPTFAKTQTLTGASLWFADGTGSYDGWDYWKTAGGGGSGSYLFIKRREKWLNDANFAIHIPLQPGIHTFQFAAEPVNGTSHLGLNLFLDDNMKTPAISAAAPLVTPKRGDPPFAAIRGRTVNMDLSAIPGAGTSVYKRGDISVELIAFRAVPPAVEKADLVSRFEALPNGTNDIVGTFTLKVTRRNSHRKPQTEATRPAMLSSLLIGPSPTIGKYNHATGVVTLTTKAGPEGKIVMLTSSDVGAATVPDSVTIPEGASSARFDIKTKEVTAAMRPTITARSGSVSKSTSLLVNPVAVDAMTLLPISVQEEDEAFLLVTLNVPSVLEETTVTLVCDQPEVAFVLPTITIPAGTNSATTTISTFGVKAKTTVKFMATLHGKTISAPLIITK